MTLTQKINEWGHNAIPFILLVDFLGESPLLFQIDELKEQDIEIQFPSFTNSIKKPNNISITLKKYPLPFEEYQQKFKVVQQHLLDGNSFLTNLTAETKIESNASLDEIFQQSVAKYKIKFQDKWVCFSPETFIQIEGNTIRSFPMKGTIDASLPNAEQVLLNDQKEIAEHYTIVDLIRNDLSIVSSNVQVKKFRYIDTIHTSDKTLLQVSSLIEGQLPQDFHAHLGTLIFSLLPAGSISGAPKKKTLDIIQEAEQYKRGFYTGTAFYFDGKNLDSCVLIRFIEQKNIHELMYKSGGGITIHSQADKEYQELIQKIYVPCI